MWFPLGNSISSQRTVNHGRRNRYLLLTVFQAFPFSSIIIWFACGKSNDFSRITIALYKQISVFYSQVISIVCTCSRYFFVALTSELPIYYQNIRLMMIINAPIIAKRLLCSNILPLISLLLSYFMFYKDNTEMLQKIDKNVSKTLNIEFI